MGEIPDATPEWMLWSAFGVVAVGAALFLLVLYWLADGHPWLQALLALGVTIAVPWLIERSRRLWGGANRAGRHALGSKSLVELRALLDQLDMEDSYVGVPGGYHPPVRVA